MDENSQMNNAIVPEDKHKQLSLPSGMIERGLELATKIDQKQDIPSVPAKANIKEYTIRCYSTIMDWIKKDNGSYTLSEADKAATNSPIYLTLSINDDGVHISCADKNLNAIGIEGNEDRYRLLNTPNNLSSFTIPFSSVGLFYTLTHGMDETLSTKRGFFSRLRKEVQKNISFTIGPGGGQHGYSGSVTKEANSYFDINRDCVETIIIYTSVLDNANLDYGLIAKNPSLKLTIVAIDQNGKDDQSASRELYHAILDAKNLNPYPKIYVSLDELYKNIPNNSSQEKNWLQWAYTFKEKDIKEKGEIQGVSIHPNEGKLFFIITIYTDKGATENKTKQIALSVKDAHTVTLGEKEGSFLLDDTKWICLGQTYTFTGLVRQPARFDKELRDTEYRDLIIVEATMADINEQ